MFEKIAQRFQTALLIVLVFMLSAVFVLQFGGPQAEGCTAGGARYAAKVYDEVITEGDFEAAYRLGGFDRQPVERQRSANYKEHVLNGLIERTLLARMAQDLGFQVEEKEVHRKLLQDGSVFLSLGVDAPRYLPQGEIQVAGPGEGFDKEQAKRFIMNYLQRSVAEFTEAQVSERLAEHQRDTVRAATTVSPREIWDTWVEEQEQARIEYVRFSPKYYRPDVEVTDEAVTSWMKDHQDEVDAEYEANKHRYTDLEKQARAKHILIKAGEDATEQEKEAARKKAEGLLAGIEAGADFEKLARKNSEDPGSARKGGDLGWNPKGRMVEEFDEVMFSLKPGEVSDIVETQFGYHIIKLEGLREGDVPVDEAKREIAERLYAEAEASDMAMKAAKEALQRWKDGASRDELDAWLDDKQGGDASADEKADPEGSQAQADAADEDDDPLRPRVRDSGMFGRGDNPISGPFDAGPLVEAAFERTTESPFPDAPISLGDEVVIYKLVERQTASKEDFTDEERRRISQRILPRKEREALRVYIEELRARAEADGAIRVHESVLSYGGEDEPSKGPSAPVGAGL